MTTRYTVTNSGRIPLSVPITHEETGQTDEIQLQPGGKPSLPEGFRVDANFLTRNPCVTEVPPSI